MRPDVLNPRGVAVVVSAQHQCMTTRGVKKPGVAMVTSRMLGAFKDVRAEERIPGLGGPERRRLISAI